ncbi:DUF300-domain-containing protein [Athelia psychrophila]|uniref:DUF300-domain-containing protein n=1 Tax=Athelia psychrophila TaxID=1759441 RepID=A0A166IAS4_9AGAM|nr:DUF300-domain-containing protein [Fibularhizoctonia sp. CBS 109695]
MVSNATCFAPTAAQEGPSFIQNGHLTIQAHDIGWAVAGLFTIIACITSFWLVNKHLQWYTNKREQRYIIRVLFMVPVYAIISLASYLFWDHSTALLLIRDGYESTVLTSFFYLLLTYLSPNPDEQKNIYRIVGISQHADREAIRAGKDVRKWLFPLGWVKKKPADGLYFLQMMKWGVLQYCIVRPTTTLAAVILNYIGWYCESSWSPEWGYVYVTIVISLSVTVAMYCLIQVYVPISGHLAPHKPLLKLFAIKAVVFLTFWQATLLSLLKSFGVVKETTYMTASEINTGISAILECFEMMVFAFLHLRAFTYKPYVLASPNLKTPRLRSLGHAFDFRETFREIGTGCAYIVDRMKGRESHVDLIARRAGVFEDAFGQGRPRPAAIATMHTFGIQPQHGQEKHAMQVEVQQEVNVDVGGERQWLGNGDDYGYGLAYASRREKDRSDGLGEAIDKELKRRRADSDNGGTPRQASDGGTSRPRTSWWRGVYNRLSQSGPDPEETARHATLILPHHYEYDDAPPASIIQTYRNSQASEANADSTRLNDSDVLRPLPPSPTPRKQHKDNASPPTPVTRSDSLLARVFPYASSTNLATSEATHLSGHMQVKTVGMGQTPSSVIVISGDDPGRVLMRSPELGQLPAPSGLDITHSRSSASASPPRHDLVTDPIHSMRPKPTRPPTAIASIIEEAHLVGERAHSRPSPSRPPHGPDLPRGSAHSESRHPTPARLPQSNYPVAGERTFPTSDASGSPQRHELPADSQHSMYLAPERPQHAIPPTVEERGAEQRPPRLLLTDRRISGSGSLHVRQSAGHRRSLDPYSPVSPGARAIYEQQQTGSHAPTDRRISDSAHAQRSAGHRPSRHSSAPLSPLSPGALSPYAPQYPGVSKPSDGVVFDPMSLYLAAQRKNALPSREKARSAAPPAAIISPLPSKRSPFTRAPAQLSIPAPLAPQTSNRPARRYSSDIINTTLPLPLAQPATGHYHEPPLSSETRTYSRR